MTTARHLDLSPIIDAYFARERAWRAGDATTSHLLELALQTAVQRRRKARVARRRLSPEPIR